MDNEKTTLAEGKLRAREQWGADPCGAVHGREREFGTREFFDDVERHRYTEYAPWMREVMGFDKFAGARLVEVGCGMGTDLLQFARGGAKCTGVDLTPRSVEISQHRFRLYDMPGDFTLADAERLPFPDNTFDVFYSNGVLHHTPETAAAVREAHRILMPGGTAKVMLYHRDSLAYWVNMMLRYGVVKGELFRGSSPADIMSKYVEFNESGGRPLVKVYSRLEAHKLFSMFSKVSVEVDQLTRPEIYFVGKLLPEWFFKAMRRTVGWNVIITAIK
ncbi:MAG: class I SAM-dependent methyltransferase [Pyrinomonadaceae bacterium]